MLASELKERFLSFFEKRGHKIIPSSPLVPRDDPTSLFISAGMQPLVPYLLGEPHPLGKKLANLQICLRTDDIDQVGDAYHHTFFEMLGNWSLGAYFKKEAISLSFEFLTQELHLPPERIVVTVFAGEGEIPPDKESATIWQSLGISKKRIYFLGREENWWGPVGETGPCGPCSEMYLEVAPGPCSENCRPGCKCGRYVEIWNDVFMEYRRTEEGKFLPLKQKNVDTGMGVERTTAVLQGKDDNYQTELFSLLIQKIEKISGLNYFEKKNKRVFRIIADHLRAAVFILAEGVLPSNVERGYVVRRLIRRVIRYFYLWNLKQDCTPQIGQTVIQVYKGEYPHLRKNREQILSLLLAEERKFRKTLRKGLARFEKIASSAKGIIDGQTAFQLYDTFGFPLELTLELAKEKGLEVDSKGFERAFLKHQAESRKGAKGRFAGGLVERSKEAIKLHTATHLLQAGLRKILGEHVQQRGSNITGKRLRFDFSHPKKLGAEEIKKIENLVNQKIRENLPVKMEILDFSEARRRGALAFFQARYPERVKVYSIADFSKEICAGPHVSFTGEIGGIKIVKSEQIGAGIQRIYAVLVKK